MNPDFSLTEKLVVIFSLSGSNFQNTRLSEFGYPELSIQSQQLWNKYTNFIGSEGTHSR